MRELKFRLYLNKVSEDELRVFLYFNLRSLICWNPIDKAFPLAAIDQFTGVLDKNKKEIYENDIVRWETNHAHGLDKIVFDDCVIGFKVKDHGNCMISLSYVKAEVIGNIHENPELLYKTLEE